MPVFLLLHEGGERTRQDGVVRADAHDFGIIHLREAGIPRIGQEHRDVIGVRVGDLGCGDGGVPAAEDDGTLIRGDRVRHQFAAAIRVASVVVELQHDPLAVDAATAVDPLGPQAG